MKKFSVVAASLFFVFTFLLSGSHAAFAQKGRQDLRVAADFRPFDFTDKYYEENGVFAFALVDRVNGADKRSVFGFKNDPIFRNVRIIETKPGYSVDGNALYWNHHAGLNKDGFTPGSAAVDLAFAYPLYAFPSITVKNTDRQASLLYTDEEYFKKNPLGIAAVILVEFTDQINTHKGQIVMKMLAERNGISLDGTPIIRNLQELRGLANNGLVTLIQADPVRTERASFAIARVLQSDENGAVTPDAYLDFVKTAEGKPLEAEEHFLSKFECLKSDKAPCL